MKTDLTPKDGDVIVVWVSFGAASAIAAYETIRRYGKTCDVRLVNNPVIEEDPDNIRFGADLERWLGYPIIKHFNPKYPSGSAVEVWQKKRFMSSPFGAPCTVELKKRARQDYESRHKVDWHVLGFTADEEERYHRFTMTERTNVLPVLIDANLTKTDCAMMLQSFGVDPPRIYKEGYPNANCIGCVKATSPTYWNLVRQTRPEIFRQRAELSRELGAKLVIHKGQRMFLDELSPDAKGRPLKTMNIECGIFCEESFPLPKKKPNPLEEGSR